MEGTKTNEETWMTEDPMQLLVSEYSIALGLLFLQKNQLLKYSLAIWKQIHR
jgi:hypothetical protein